MRSITTVELAALVNELKEFDGFYIDNFYETEEDRFRLRLSRAKAKANLNIALSQTINKTEHIEIQEKATNFAIAARKRLEGFVIERIEQLDNDRIAVFELKKGAEKAKMIIEMFGKGNLIITDDKSNILLAYKVHDFKDRSVRPGVGYVPPKKGEARFEMPKKIAPVLYLKDGNVVDYAVTEQEKYKGYEKRETGSLQEALDIYYRSQPRKQEKTQKEKELEELGAAIEKQERILAQLDKEIESNKKIGESIMKDISMINHMISAAKSNKRITKEELQAITDKIKVLSVDLKNKTFTIEMKD